MLCHIDRRAIEATVYYQGSEEKAAKILLAANNAVRLRVTEQILTQLSNLAQE